MKFNTGTIVATPGVLEAFERNQQTPMEFLQRHIAGDWGCVCKEDGLLNDQAVIDGSRLLSAYLLKDGTKVWIVTEAVGENGQREATTFLLPSEY